MCSAGLFPQTCFSINSLPAALQFFDVLFLDVLSLDVLSLDVLSLGGII